MKTPKTRQAKAEFYTWLANEKKMSYEDIQEIARFVNKITKTLLDKSEEQVIKLIQSIKTRV